MGSQNEITIQTRDLIDGATTHRGGAKVKGGIGGREPTTSQGTFGKLPLFGRKQFRWTE